ncbi:MAG: CPBP family intramembrane metalloprotease [Ruminococcaceae bacterium]|nr:CPBP family intramembrane metalloprotease [Oscillospiraceae bacterium]
MLKLINRQSEMIDEVRQAKRMPRLIWQLPIFLLVFFAINIVITIVTTVAVVAGAILSPEFREIIMSGKIYELLTGERMMIVQLFITVAETIVAIIYCRLIEKRSLRSMGFRKKGWFKDYLSGYGIGALMICGSALICLLAGTLTFRVSVKPDLVVIGLAFLGYLVQGMAEEVLVRGYLMNSLIGSIKGKAAVPVAVIVSSVIFAALHLGNPGMTALAFVNLTLAGIVFALMVIRTDNIWVACAAHSAWNFFQGHVIGSQVSGLTQMSSFLEAATQGSAIINGGSFGLEGGLGVTAVELIAIILMLVIPEKKKAAVEAPAAEAAVEAPAEEAAVEAPAEEAAVEAPAEEAAAQ